MHDLNDALDELRSVIPYAHSPSVRKLSKIATLLLAKNYILMQVENSFDVISLSDNIFFTSGKRTRGDEEVGVLPVPQRRSAGPLPARHPPRLPLLGPALPSSSPL